MTFTISSPGLTRAAANALYAPLSGAGLNQSQLSVALDGYVQTNGADPILLSANSAQTQLALQNLSTTSSSLAAAQLAFQLADTSGTTITAARVGAGKEQTWTSTASTRDGYLALYTAVDGVLSEGARLTSAGTLQINKTSGNSITVGDGSGINFTGGGGVTLTAESSARLNSSAIIRSDNGFWIGGVISQWATSGITFAANSATAWLRQTQSSPRDVRLIGQTNGSGQIAAQIGTAFTDALNGQAGTLLALCTDNAGTTPTVKWFADGYGNVSGGGLKMSSVTTNLTSAASNVVFKYTSANRIQPQVSWDGYGFHDSFAGLVKFKDANQAVSASTVLVDDTYLNFGTLDAFSRYIIEGNILVSNSTTGGAKVDLAGTAGLQTFGCDIFVEDVTSAAFSQAGRITSLGSGGIGSTAVSGHAQSIQIRGVIQVSTTGTLKLQVAQNSSAGTTTFLAGSWMKLIKI